MLAEVIPTAIPLRRRDGSVSEWALVDSDDYERLAQYKWTPRAKGYAGRSAGSERILMHREVVGCVKGDGLDVDHENHNRLDNRRCNLRVCTRSENMQNRARGSKGFGRSKHRGVCWSARAHKWVAYGRLNYKSQHLGVFDREEDAAEVARLWREENMPFAAG